MPGHNHSFSDTNGTNRWRHFLELAVSSTGASGGALWQVDAASPSLLAQHQLGDLPLDKVHQQWPGHVESLAAVIESGQSKSLEAQFEQSNTSQSLRLFLLPIASGTVVQLILELFIPRDKPASLDQVEESVKQLLLWASPVGNSQAESSSLEFATWLSQIHAKIDLTETSCAVTNETKNWSGWDRVSLLLRSGRNFELRSVSGVDVLDPRSSTVKHLVDLANSIGELAGPLDTSGDTSHPDLEEYRQKILAERVAVIALQANKSLASRSPLGLLVFDQFAGQRSDYKSIDQLQVAARHITTAVEHSLEFAHLSRGVLSRSAQQLFSRKFAKAATALLFLALLTGFLCVIKTELVISGTGYLEPVIKHDVFAGTNGLIQTLHVEQGELINEGDVLLTLRSPELEFEENRLRGELATVRQQRADLETLRTDPRRVAELKASSNELAAREKELLTVAANLERQIALLEKQSEDLTLVSPISGEVVTWDFKSLLVEDRPVSRTDRLLSVAQLSGGWRAKLLVDHRDTGPVVAAVENETAKLTFVTADSPERQKAATVTDIAKQLTTDSISGTTLSVSAEVNRSDIQDVRPGTSILFRMECGQRPVGYVWFRRLIDRLQTWWVLSSSHRR